MTHPATNGIGWEIQEFSYAKGWVNPFKDPDGTPQRYATEQTAATELKRLLSVTNCYSKNFRVYEALDPHKGELK